MNHRFRDRTLRPMGGEGACKPRTSRLVPGLLLMISVATFFFGSCATKPPISITHTPRQGGFLPEFRDKAPAVLLVRVRGNRDRVWYRVGEHTWSLEKEPVDIVREALEAELRAIGVHVTDDPGRASGLLDTEIRWFAPYGHSYLTAAVILSLALYPNGSANPIWRGRLQGGEYTRPPVFRWGGCNPLIEEMANRALGKAVEQLRWKAELAQAIDRLPGTEPIP